MTKHTSVQLSEATLRKIRELAQAWDYPPERNISRVIQRAIEETHRREIRRKP